MHAFAKPWLLRSALMLLGALTGCANTAPIASERICPAWPQVNIRKADRITEATAKDIEKVNTGRESFGCPYEKPRKMTVTVAQK